MEYHSTSSKSFSFQGSGSQLFGIQIINLLLTVVTLGLYYPWAKAAYLKYMYQSTEYEGSRFAFEGTGKEMFKGFIKAILVLGLMYAVLVGLTATQDQMLALLGMLLFWSVGVVLYPVVVHGSLRYRMARTTWRGIYFGYRGDLKTLVKLFVRDFFLTIITFGIYGSWLTMHMRNYTMKHIRFGNLEFDYEGDGGDFLVLNIKGYFLTLFTLGIYLFWWQKDLLNYWLENLRIKQGDKVIQVQSTVSGSNMFGLLAGNLLIIIFTLGLGAPWATVRTFKYLFDNATLSEPLNTAAIRQTEEEYRNATADELGDVMDMGILGV